MKAKNTKPVVLADSAGVDTYMQKLDHPLRDVLEALRKTILSIDSEIGEQVKWNSPSFLYIGEMKPFNPKEYKRYLIVSNIYQKDCIRLVFPSGAKINDTLGLLTGDYADGRRLAFFYNIEEVAAKEGALRNAVKTWLMLLDK
jgi:hypothetical protein